MNESEIISVIASILLQSSPLIIAVGAGHYSAAIIVSVIVFFVLISMRSVELKIAKSVKNKNL